MTSAGSRIQQQEALKEERPKEKGMEMSRKVLQRACEAGVGEGRRPNSMACGALLLVARRSSFAWHKKVLSKLSGCPLSTLNDAINLFLKSPEFA